MKHYVLLWVRIPDHSEGDKLSHWETLRRILEGKEKNIEGIVVLAENTWLLPRDSGLPFLAECIAWAHRHSLEHKSWFLDEG